MLQLGDYYRENLTMEKVDALIDECRNGQVNLH
jgi:NADH-quinone oxidoreductase subunit E